MFRLFHQNQSLGRVLEQLELFKFVCKEFWTSIFRKPVDNLRTNHLNVFILHDNNFPWALKFSADQMSNETAKMTILVL